MTTRAGMRKGMGTFVGSLVLIGAALAQDDGGDRPRNSVPPGLASPVESDPDAPRGLRHWADGAFEGYTLVVPLNSRRGHLVGLDGEVVHTWEFDTSPGAWSYLMDDGNLLRGGRTDDDPRFRGGGIAGVVQLVAPDSSVLWSWRLADENQHMHHDIEPLPNGNVLMIAWERKSAAEAMARGRHESGVDDSGLWPDKVIEVKPILPNGAEIVWEWHAWDHLVQDRDPSLPNHGSIAEHPHRIDINAELDLEDPPTEEELRELEEVEAQLEALGYLGGYEEEDDDSASSGSGGDWLHTNSVDYHAGLDLIALSTPNLSELWIIDHSTTTAEAAGSTGGRHGRGGDLLWRWGNPEMHGAGTSDDQRLFYQHNPTFHGNARDGLRLLVFNNGGRRPGDEDFSAVEELLLPYDAKTGFARPAPGRPFEAELLWDYASPESFFSAFISGAQRLPNGNTLVCSGVPGRVFEVTPAGEVVWDYYNPLGGDISPPAHAGNAPALALFRAERYGTDHPGVRVVLGRD